MSMLCVVVAGVDVVVLVMVISIGRDLLRNTLSS